VFYLSLFIRPVRATLRQRRGTRQLELKRDADLCGHDVCARAQHVEEHVAVFAADRAFPEILGARTAQVTHTPIEQHLDAARVRVQPHVQAAAEAVRQLRQLARAREVAVRLSPDLPAVEVNAAAVELCLTNYISNAIKYSDPAKAERWVEIRSRLEQRRDDDGAAELIVEVSDNGLGVPDEARRKLFDRFFRAHAEGPVSGVEGTGLGLSIVRETVAMLGGRAWAEPGTSGGSVFAFSLPCRRGSDSSIAAQS